MTPVAPPRGGLAGVPTAALPEPPHVPGARDTQARRARALIAVLALVLAWACAPYLAGLVGAVVLYVLCAPAYRWLAPRLGQRRSAFVLVVAASLLLVVPALLLIAAALQEAPGALRRVAESSLFTRAAALQVGPIDLGVQVERAGDAALAWLSSRVFDVAGSVTRALLNLLIALVGAYYLLPSASQVWEHVRPLIPFSRAGADALGERFVSVTEATLLGIAATSASQGLVVGVAFWLVGLPNAIVWGVVTSITSLLPILGSSLVWLPGALVLAADGRYGAAIVLALIGLIVASNIDNVVRPSVYRRVSGMHPMATLVGAFAGVELLGLPGLLLGPLAITYALELLRLYRLEYGT
ncbi:MAG TPA: AI-2E family transporter [Gemmatimonadaceae bacterium]|nr:AI-2E family transporter [Gemmatimonadaceae bacterium]